MWVPIGALSRELSVLQEMTIGTAELSAAPPQALSILEEQAEEQLLGLKESFAAIAVLYNQRYQKVSLNKVPEDIWHHLFSP